MNEKNDNATGMDIYTVFEKLPHRYPFLLVDRVTECIPGELLVALKNVTINEPYFPGHFPHRPVIAGMVGFVGHLEIADDVAITGLTMISRSISEPGIYSGGLPADEAVRWRKNSARFKQLDDLARTVKGLEKVIGNRKKHE